MAYPSNYSAWLGLGAKGLDSAFMYGDDVQVAVGDAIAEKIRDDLFVTSKVPCCPARFTKFCDWYASEYETLSPFGFGRGDARLLGVKQVDPMLLHWPCETMEQTVAAYRSLEDFQLRGYAK